MQTTVAALCGAREQMAKGTFRVLYRQRSKLAFLDVCHCSMRALATTRMPTSQPCKSPSSMSTFIRNDVSSDLFYNHSERGRAAFASTQQPLFAVPVTIYLFLRPLAVFVVVLSGVLTIVDSDEAEKQSHLLRLREIL